MSIASCQEKTVSRVFRPLKRLADLLTALIMIVITAPLFAVLAAVVRRDGGPAFFLHERIGQGGKTFRVIKFRTMIVDAERRLREDHSLYNEYLTRYKTEDESLVTTLGLMLRRTYLDELPQLVNVLRGEMSLVGPRPVVRPEIGEFGDLAGKILSVPPGMTGLWQLNKDAVDTYDERARMEADYIENWSLLRDVAIFVRTVVLFMRLLIGEIYRSKSVI